MMRLRSGELRHVVTIQHIIGTDPDEFGGEINAWGNYLSNIRAKRLPLSGRELIDAGAAKSEVIDRWYIRYHPGIKPTMRLLHDNMVHEITSVIEVGGGQREIEIMTRATIVV